MAKRKRPLAFSRTKAVKANARERLGTPPPATVLPDDRTKGERRASKHRTTLEKLLQHPEDER